MGQFENDTDTYILGKDLSLEQTISNMTGILASLGMKIEISSWRNIVPNVWSLHIRDAASPACFTNGKGSTKESALCSALGEFVERLNCNFFTTTSILAKRSPTATLCIIQMKNGLNRGQMTSYQ